MYAPEQECHHSGSSKGERRHVDCRHDLSLIPARAVVGIGGIASCCPLSFLAMSLSLLRSLSVPIDASTSTSNLGLGGGAVVVEAHNLTDVQLAIVVENLAVGAKQP